MLRTDIVKNIVELNDQSKSNDSLLESLSRKIPSAISSENIDKAVGLYDSLKSGKIPDISSATGLVNSILNDFPVDTIKNNIDAVADTASRLSTAADDIISFDPSDAESVRDVAVNLLDSATDSPIEAIAQGAENVKGAKDVFKDAFNNVVDGTKPLHTVSSAYKFDMPLTDSQQYSAMQGIISLNSGLNDIVTPTNDQTEIQEKISAAITTTAVEEGINVFEPEKAPEDYANSDSLLTNLLDSADSLITSNAASIAFQVGSTLINQADTKYKSLLALANPDLFSTFTNIASKVKDVASLVYDSKVISNISQVINTGYEKVVSIDIVARKVANPTVTKKDIDNAKKVDPTINIPASNLFYDNHSTDNPIEEFAEAAKQVQTQEVLDPVEASISEEVKSIQEEFPDLSLQEAEDLAAERAEFREKYTDPETGEIDYDRYIQEENLNRQLTWEELPSSAKIQFTAKNSGGTSGEPDIFVTDI